MSVIAYHPPKTVSHGHGPRARSVRKAWDATQTFLRQQTIAVLRAPLQLSIFGAGQWTDASVVERVRAEATALFGPASVSGESHSWELPVERLAEALEFAFADEDRPQQQLGPVHFHAAYSFDWRIMPNPPQSGPREHFRGGNRLGVSIIGRRLVIQPTFLFGASDQDADFVDKLKALQSTMPFVPKDSYYYRLEAKKTGKGDKLVKLPRGWQGAV